MATTTKKQDQELREKVLSIEQTQTQVLIPKVNEVATDIKTLVNRDYITKTDAEAKFVSKDEFSFIKNLVYGVITAVIIGFITLGFTFLQGKL